MPGTAVALATSPAAQAGGAGGGAAGNWWEAGGASGVVAAYTAKGAASLAASYVNVANPGTFDAAPGVAPTWNVATGWTFDGASRYLTTGITVTQAYTLAVAFTGAPSAVQVILGHFGALYNRLLPNRLSQGVGYGQTYVLPGLTSGVLVLAGANGYRNGVSETGAADIGSGTNSPYIGAQNSAGSPGAYYGGSVQAVAIYNNVLTAPQVAALSTAMAAI